MWASRRQEALRRAAEYAGLAELVRVEARETHLLAVRYATDEEACRSLHASASEMEEAAETYDRIAGSYMAMLSDAAERYDDDADGR